MRLLKTCFSLGIVLFICAGCGGGGSGGSSSSGGSGGGSPSFNDPSNGFTAENFYTSVGVVESGTANTVVADGSGIHWLDPDTNYNILGAIYSNFEDEKIDVTYKIQQQDQISGLWTVRDTDLDSVLGWDFSPTDDPYATFMTPVIVMDTSERLWGAAGNVLVQMWITVDSKGDFTEQDETDNTLLIKFGLTGPQALVAPVTNN